MTLTAVVRDVLVRHGITDVEPLVVVDLLAAAMHADEPELRAMCDRHGFVAEGRAGELARDIVQAVKEASR